MKRTATGTVAQVKAAFQVSQKLYAFNGLTLRANAQDPTVPASFAAAVTSIDGLDDSELLIHPLRATKGRPASVLAPTNAVTSPSAPPPVSVNLPAAPCDTYWGDPTATNARGAWAIFVLRSRKSGCWIHNFTNGRWSVPGRFR